MNFGYSVSDFIVLGQLAWRVYKSCKDAPDGFKNVSQEVLSLHAVLKEVEETFSQATLSAAQQSRHRTVGNGCRSVLEDLQGILDKYKSLGTKTKRTWDRLAWCSNDIAELRSRLISNTVLLTTIVNTSQITVKKKLDEFAQEFREGKHEGSVVSAQTVDSLSRDERRAWRAIRKELEVIGISVAAFDANKEFIVNWFKTAICTGAFEEQTAEDGSSSINQDEYLGQSLKDAEHVTLLSQPLEDQRHDRTSTSDCVDLEALGQFSAATHQSRRSPRVVRLIGWLFRYNLDFFKAVQNGDETKMRHLLEKGVNINVKDVYGDTPLHHAVSLKSEAMVRLLLRMGADIHAKDNAKHTALQRAAKFGHETVVKPILENGARIDEKFGDGNTALHLSARYGHKTVVQLLLEHGANTNTKNRSEYNAQDGFTALHLATVYEHETVVELLLRNGAEIDKKSGDGDTALHLAIMNPKRQRSLNPAMQMLLQSGAKPYESNGDGYRPLDLAAKLGHERAVQLLLDYGADTDQENEGGYSALHVAAVCKQVAVVNMLLNNGANINKEDRNGQTAVHLAVIYGHEMVGQLLLERGASY